MDLSSMSPESGRLLAEDGGVVNIVDLLNANAVPVSAAVHDINAYSPRSGRVIGEDGKLYNLVDLLEGIGSGGSGGDCSCEPPSVTETIRIEATGDNVLTVYRNDVPTAVGAGNLDTGSFAVGKDYYVYLDGNEVIISLNAALSHRKIGGVHYGVNRRSNSALQPVNTAGAVRGADWEANTYNGILPGAFGRTPTARSARRRAWCIFPAACGRISIFQASAKAHPRTARAVCTQNTTPCPSQASIGMSFRSG